MTPRATTPAALANDHPVISELTLERLALDDADRFVALLQSAELDAADLALAAEIGGRACGDVRIVDVLLGLLSHASPIVREASIYGLFPHLPVRPDARERLQLMSSTTHEPSDAVRQAAADALALLEG